MPGGTIGSERFDEFRELHAQGLGRNAIAREMGFAPVMVSRTAEHLGLTFDRSQIQAAADARRADVEERRSILAERFVTIAEDCLDRIYQPATVYSFGGKDNTYEEHEFDEAPVAERVKFLTGAAIAVDKSLKLAPPQESSGLDAAKSMLGSLGEALTAFSRAEDEREQQSEGDEG
ncbi:hypothetical protein O3Q52_19910 [Streptomyces sp. ActVer]|uniref:hypothetical protein n=1 Tax=Streptomyces sp. ActVer TaxID=3014558 RepID=UPI0022B3FCD7|nr:hypothetical protein [Streptomyces sp. ActVer]MCZ4510412.1 hypothetical protein [Streptomyces sp. ActVer]